MAETSPDSDVPRPRRPEYEDPHFHDEEAEIQQDEAETWRPRGPHRKNPARRPLPHRRHYED